MRRTITVTVPGERSEQLGQRDNGKSFTITEMSADQAERWALRALLALGKAGAGNLEIPADAKNATMATIAELGFKALAGVNYDDAAPLFDEMMGCVRYVPEAAGVAPQPILGGTQSQIEEVRTRVWLRMKVFELHTGFSLPEAPPTSG